MSLWLDGLLGLGSRGFGGERARQGKVTGIRKILGRRLGQRPPVVSSLEPWVSSVCGH